MVKSDYISKVSLVVGKEKHAIIREFQQLIAAYNGDLVDGRISIVGKPAEYEYKKTFEEQGVAERILFENTKKVKPDQPGR